MVTMSTVVMHCPLWRLDGDPLVMAVVDETLPERWAQIAVRCSQMTAHMLNSIFDVGSEDGPIRWMDGPLQIDGLVIVPNDASAPRHQVVDAADASFDGHQLHADDLAGTQVPDGPIGQLDALGHMMASKRRDVLGLLEMMQTKPDARFKDGQVVPRWVVSCQSALTQHPRCERDGLERSCMEA